jgi:hypothetical protein
LHITAGAADKTLRLGKEVVKDVKSLILQDLSQFLRARLSSWQGQEARFTV